MRRSHLLAAVRWVLAGLVLVAVTVALARNWAAVSGYLREVDGTALLLAGLLALASPPFTLLGWRTLLADLGTALPLPPAASVFFVGQLGKYVPGSVWSVVAQTEMGARLGVSRRRMGVVGLLTMGLAALTGVLAGLPALPLLLTRAGGQLSGWWIVAAGLLGCVLFWPRVLNAGIAVVLRVLRREPLEHDLGGRAVVTTAAWFLLAWLAAGLSVLTLAHTVAPEVPYTHLFTASVAGFALASSIGMFAVVLPAGFGVRDGALVLLLGSVMPVAAATAVVVLSRFLTVAADVLVAGAGWAWGRAHHLLGSRA
ncbi:MAG TPA: lysylphosphatidylglycerol synthase domain-containing protein [Dermatophilaceae bacterium]|nr:lysylphosphatidylglycerol synthase domain-containing protein [Dermatophilaceae bacterium]